MRSYWRAPTGLLADVHDHGRHAAGPRLCRKLPRPGLKVTRPAAHNWMFRTRDSSRPEQAALAPGFVRVMWDLGSGPNFVKRSTLPIAVYIRDGLTTV